MTAGEFNDAGLLLTGKVTKPHGIRGEVKIFPLSAHPENFREYKWLYLSPGETQAPRRFVIEKSRVQGKLVLVKLAGCDSRNEAEELSGQSVWLEREQMPALTEGEFYWHDLAGKTVETVDGRVLGVVAGLMETGGHDILGVTDGDQEYLIPVCDEFIVSYDGQKVVLDPPPGLLEINRS